MPLTKNKDSTTDFTNLTADTVSDSQGNLRDAINAIANDNLLINGDFKINQRGVANWGAVAIGDYGRDRWKKVDASNITQIIEDGNFEPATEHTLSIDGVSQSVTSPASGHWTLPNIPNTATRVKLEKGSQATPFVTASRAGIGGELALCQRYYETALFAQSTGEALLASRFYYQHTIYYQVEKRVSAAVSTESNNCYATQDGPSRNAALTVEFGTTAGFIARPSDASRWHTASYIWRADSEL